MRRVGQFHRAGIENDLEGNPPVGNSYEMLIIAGYTLMTWQKVFGNPGDEYQLFLMQMRKAMKDSSVHGYMRVRFITARKP